MCGIAGILRVHPAGQPPPLPWESIPERWLDILDDSIKHRGPDGAGRFRDRALRADGSTVDVALVHRRLSIIDHAGGHQPMVSCAKGQGVVPVKTYALGEGLGPYVLGEYERLRARSASEAVNAPDLVAVVFNGCIYNHRELRKELEGAGHVFSTDHSDTEVLVHGWREWGLGGKIEDGLYPVRRGGLAERLEGMFAWMAWDKRSGRLHIARDHFGEKPLHYAWFAEGGSQFLVVSSCPAGAHRMLAALASSPSPLDPPWLADWVRFGFASQPPAGIDTAIPSTVTSLAPSQNCSDDPDLDRSWFEPGPRGGAFWEGMFGEIGLPRGSTLTPEVAEQLLTAAVVERLETDVPLGSFLSGGVDSSLVSLFACRALGKLNTFTVRMPDPLFDESSHAAAAARIIGSSHASLDCLADPADDLRLLIEQLGEPFGDSSLLPAHWVSRAARRHVTVALSGDGGDELFAGYDRYRAADILAWCKWGLRLLPRSLFSSTSPKQHSARLRRLIDAARNDGYLDLISIFPISDLRRLGLRSRTPPSILGPHSNAECGVAWDLCNYLPNDLMRKSDTASMAAALEVRSPFLDPKLAGAAASATLASLMPNNQRKGLLRHVARKYFPPEIVDRPKMGFAIPIGEWFRSNHGGMRELLLDHLNSAEPFGPPSLGIDLNMAFVRQMLKEHDDAGEQSIFPWKGRDHSQRLYMLLVLSIWAKWLGSLQALCASRG